MGEETQFVQIDKLPDSLLLDIITYLDISALLTVANVNRRFYRLTQDKRFWKRLDLVNLRFLTLAGIKKFIRRPSAVHLISLRWEGYVRRSPGQRGSTTRTRVLQAATPAILSELGQRCPNLRELHIVYANLDQVTLRDFPETLEFLGFEGCVVSYDFFGPLNDPNLLPGLRGMDLNYCHNLSSHSRHSLPGILSRDALTVLQLKHCFKISAEDLAKVPVQLSNLQTLNVSDLVTVDANFIRVLAENARLLKRLDISFCYAVDTAAITPLAKSAMCRLEKLYMIETRITDDALPLFAQYQPQLKYLNIVKTACTADGVAAFSRQMDFRCQIEHKSNNVSEKVGASFWWVDIRFNRDVDGEEPMD